MLSNGFLLQARYRVTRILGSGGFATVYLAEDMRLGGRYVAVKEFDVHRLPPADQGWARQYFQNEVQVLSKLRHESIASVIDFFSWDGMDCLVMEYVPGETLFQTRQRLGGRIHHEQVLMWAQELCRVLDYLHKQNPPIIFRDLKPDNVMVQSDGHLKIIDFGIVRHFKPGQAHDTQVLGTPGYAAPEQYGQGQTDARSDIYSLAVVLHQLLTGHDPTLTPMNFPDLLMLSPHVPLHIATAIHCALDTNPERRFSQVQDFAAALGVPITGSMTMGTVISKPTGKAVRSRTGVVLGVGFLLSAVIGYLLWGDAWASIVTIPTAAVNTQVVMVIVTDTLRPTLPESLVPATGTATVAIVTSVLSTETPVPPIHPSPTPTPTVPPSTTPVLNQNRPILFDSTRNEPQAEIYIMNADGSNPRRLTNNNEQDDDADLSPDGQWIAFDRGQSTTESIWLMRIDGSSARLLVRGRLPDWSPDGRYLAYESLGDSPHIWILDLNTGSTRQLTSGARLYRAPDWSPDGQEVVAMSQFGNDWQIMVINAATGTERQITSGNGDKRYPAWSPDASLIAFNTLDSIGWPDDIWVIEPSGNGARAITSSGKNGRPTWSPDSHYLLFNSYINNRWVLYQVDLNGKQSAQLTTEGSDQRASWSN